MTLDTFMAGVVGWVIGASFAWWLSPFPLTIWRIAGNMAACAAYCFAVAYIRSRF